MEDYVCLPDSRKRVPMFDPKVEESYLTILIPKLREELANYIPYDEIPYSLEEKYWKRRGEIFGANTPTKEEYGKVYLEKGGCTYGEELRKNIRGCFLEAANTADLSELEPVLASVRVVELAKKASLMQIPLIDDGTDIRSWKPFTVLATLITVGAIDVVSKLPHDDYITLVTEMLHFVEKDSKLSAYTRDILFFNRVNRIVHDRTEALVMHSESGYLQAMYDTFQRLITVIQPSSRLLEGFDAVLENFRLGIEICKSS